MNIEEIRIERIRKRIPQGKLAKQIGTSQARLSLVENGMATLNSEEVKKICKVLGLRSEDIEEVSTSAFDGHID